MVQSTHLPKGWRQAMMDEPPQQLGPNEKTLVPYYNIGRTEEVAAKKGEEEMQTERDRDRPEDSERDIVTNCIYTKYDICNVFIILKPLYV